MDNSITVVNLDSIKDDDLNSALNIFIHKRKEFHEMLDSIKEKYYEGYSYRVINETIACYSPIELIYDVKYMFPGFKNDDLLENKPSCEQKKFDEIAEEIGGSKIGMSEISVSDERLKDIYNTLKNTGDPDWNRIAERLDDKGLLRSVCNNLANIIRLKDINKMCSGFLNNINCFSEISSLKAFTDGCDPAKQNAIFDELDRNVIKFYRDLINNRVRVPHYETLILSYIIVIDVLDNEEKELCVNKEYVRKLLLNIYDQIFREFKLRKRVLGQIETAITVYKSQEIDNNIIKELIERYLIIYKNVLTNVRSESESNIKKLIEKEPRFSDWKELVRSN